MGYELREMSLGEILDQGFRVMRDHFVPIVGCLAVVDVPFGVATALAGEGLEDSAGAADLGNIGLVLGLTLVYFVVVPLCQLAATRLTAAAYLGESMTMGQAFREGARAYMPYLGTAMLMGIALMFLALLLVVPALYFSICWLLVGPIAMVEDTFGTNALRRSRALVKGDFWHTFGVAFTVGIISMAASMGPGIVLSAIPVAGSILGACITAVANALMVVCIVILYFELRCRKEDFDLVRLAQQVGSDAVQPDAATPSTEAGGA